MHITTIFIWFIFYSILGWIYETAFCTIKDLKWDNRGMLMGPYCPIYGVGAVLDVLLCSNLPNGAAVFFASMVGSAVLEYVTSYTTERLFHAVWWDYSNMPLNLHGRICLPCSVGFGAGGVIILYLLHPGMVRLTEAIPLSWQEPLALLLMAVFAADCALTADSLMALNVKLEAMVNELDCQISEKYDAFVENRQNRKRELRDGLDSFKEKISLEEFREHRIKEEIKDALASMNWGQRRALRSAVAFPHSRYNELKSRMKSTLSVRKKKLENDADADAEK